MSFIMLWKLNEHHNFFAVNMGSLIKCARQRGQWNFFCRAKQLALIGCLEDSTNEVMMPQPALPILFLVVYILLKYVKKK